MVFGLHELGVEIGSRCELVNNAAPASVDFDVKPALESPFGIR